MKLSETHYSGRLSAPASKSHGQRLLIAAAISETFSPIKNLGTDRDTLAMQAALKNLRSKQQNSPIQLIDVGESGFALRTLAFVAHHFCSSYHLNGSGTILQRTHWATIRLLEQLGLNVSHQDGKLPLEINGTISNTQLEVDGTDGSQYVSGLFLLAAKHPGYWQITINNLNSRPYFEMTLEVLVQFGFKYQVIANTYTFEGAQRLSCSNLCVEGDWSSVAAHLVAAAINGEIQVSGLNPNSLQPDKYLLEALTVYGAEIAWENETLLLKSTSHKRPFEFDFTQQPDLFPVMVVLACSVKGISTLSGIHRLKNKESDRLQAMCEALSKWGVSYELNGMSLNVYGSGIIEACQVNTYHDHRIVMAASIANMLSAKVLLPTDSGALQKSYPGFLTDFQRLLKH
jgi:3-phosphoshikimate 1-carboxyvinyltransferase